MFKEDCHGFKFKIDESICTLCENVINTFVINEHFSSGICARPVENEDYPIFRNNMDLWCSKNGDGEIYSFPFENTKKEIIWTEANIIHEPIGVNDFYSISVCANDIGQFEYCKPCTG